MTGEKPMFETNINLIGHVATDVKFVVMKDSEGKGDGLPFARFRVASNSRKFDKSTDTWVPGDTLFASVVCFRRLAEHVTSSLKKGDPVLVYGKLRTRQWKAEDNRSGTELEITANAVGHNLTFGTAMFSRSLYRTQPDTGIEEPFAQPVGGQSSDADSSAPLADVSVLSGARQVTDIRSVGAPADMPGARPARPGEEGYAPHPEPSPISPAADEQAA
jgi:single-strand DNA-binding protein